MYASRLLSLLERRFRSSLVAVIDRGLAGDVDPVLPFPAIGFDESEKMRDGIYFTPSFTTHHLHPLFNAWRRGTRTAAVVHDLIPLRRPAHEVGVRNLTRFKRVLERFDMFDLVVANSNYTKSDLAVFSADPDAIAVLHPRSRFAGLNSHAVGGPFLSHRDKYIFFATADDGRKNFAISADTAGYFISNNINIYVGGGISPASIDYFFVNGPQPGIEFLPFLSDDDLASAYANSLAVVVPSFDEGFSMPVLEACEMGCRVIASDIPAHREQIVDTRRLFDPLSPESLIAAFEAARRDDATPFRQFDHGSEEDMLLAQLSILLKESC